MHANDNCSSVCIALNLPIKKYFVIHYTCTCTRKGSGQMCLKVKGTFKCNAL